MLKKIIKIMKTDDNSLKIIDWAVLLVVAIFCYFTMQQGDILHTGGSSFSLLNGHIFDFYDYTAQYFGVNNYMISTYILFAIWNIPIRLLGWVTTPTLDVGFQVHAWYKALPVCCFILSGILIYKIVREIGFSQDKSKITMYAFYSMPIAVFSQFCFGQYDIFTVVFMLMGIYYYFKDGKKSFYLFCLFFGIAATFKYFSLLVFIPLLVLREKNIWKLIKYLLITFIPVAIVVLPYLHSEAFRNGVFGFGATGYIFNISVNNGLGTISVMPVLWIVLCLFCFLKEPILVENEASGKDVLFKWFIFVTNVIMFLSFGLSFWHPQWLLMAVPFWTLGLITRKRIDVSSIINILMVCVFFVIVVNIWPNHVDQQLFERSAFKYAVEGRLGSCLTMREFYHISDMRLMWTAFVGLLLANTIMQHPKYSEDDITVSVKKSFGWIRATFIIGFSAFLIPMVICLISAINTPVLSYSPSSSIQTYTPPMVDSDVIGQTFVPKEDNIYEVEVLIGTHRRVNHFSLQMDIIDMETKDVLFTKKIDASTLIDNAYEKISFDAVQVEEGKPYCISFSSEGADPNNAISIYRTGDNTSDESSYAIVNGERQSYNLALQVYSK